jgi:uncharacterized protein DUF3467
VAAGRESTSSEEGTAQRTSPGGTVTQQQIQVDDSRAIASYSNFCRVTGTPEELIIDFALNPQPMGIPSEALRITQRIVTNYYTAKRLLHALHLTVQRHESVFGVLETDIQKRVSPSLRGS